MQTEKNKLETRRGPKDVKKKKKEKKKEKWHSKTWF